MSLKVQTKESRRLARASQMLQESVEALGGDRVEARFQLLEAAACRLGSHKTREYFRAFKIKPLASIGVLEASASAIITLIEQTEIDPALALSALAREELSTSEQRTTGAYHTDFRLARRLARSIAPQLTRESRVIDPACGAGILLVALTLEVCGHDRRATAQFFKESVHAADLSPLALRGALLALASLTDDLSAVIAMRGRWFAGDSLLLSTEKWRAIAPGGFDALIANPPWERVRLTRHEFARSVGGARHYGSSIGAEHLGGLTQERQRVASYVDQLAQRHPLILGGEPDLYTAFMSLYLEQLRPGGCAAVLVPGGLIRSQGTSMIRREIFEVCDRIEIGVFDNKARFFGIDSRFKFLALMIRRAEADGARGKPVVLTHEVGTEHGTGVAGRARLARGEVARISPDLSLPEVSGDDEWQLFKRLVASGERMDDPSSPWFIDPCREVDMTTDRAAFAGHAGGGRLALIEGRHLQQFRFGAKAYQGGTGRAAHWEALPFGRSRVQAQFFVAPERCGYRAQARADLWRAGFCDIAGQTNERSMMAALIPPGVVCGNKVPTVLFPNDPGSLDRLKVWTAVVNSLAFDWILRRVLTTTINYFVLYSVPIPCIRPGGLPWKRLVKAVDALHGLDNGGRSAATDTQAADLRREIEVEVCQAFGLSLEDVELMLADFPLLDRGQPPLEGEARSTITRDTVLAALARRTRRRDMWGERAECAAALGAVAYVPAQMTDQGHGAREEAISAGNSI